MSDTATMTHERVHLSEKTPHVRHVYHKCTRDKNPRTAFCGHKCGPGYGVQYDPKLLDVCMVCTELVKVPCKLCNTF